MPSKVVTDHQKLTEQVRQALDTHGPAITAAVLTVTSAENKKHAVDVAPLFAHAQRETAGALRALTRADDDHQDELADDDEARKKRDEASAELRGVLIDLKKATASLFGDAWVKRLSFPAEVPTDPAAVQRTADQVILALGKVDLPKPKIPGVAAVDGATWKRTIEKPLGALAAARGDVNREVEEARATLAARDRALADLVGANVAAAQLTQALARIGGVQHLVAGLRGTLDTSAPSLSSDEAPAPAPAPA